MHIKLTSYKVQMLKLAMLLKFYYCDNKSVRKQMKFTEIVHCRQGLLFSKHV